MNWIKFSDRMPEVGARVLVATRGRTHVVAKLIVWGADSGKIVRSWDRGGCEDGSWFGTEGTHWMPLPELPK